MSEKIMGAVQVYPHVVERGEPLPGSRVIIEEMRLVEEPASLVDSLTPLLRDADPADVAAALVAIKSEAWCERLIDAVGEGMQP